MKTQTVYESAATEATRRARAVGGTPEQQSDYFRDSYAGILASLGIKSLSPQRSGTNEKE